MQPGFFLNSDQQLFKESLARTLKDGWTLSERRKLSHSEPGYSTKLWKALAALGAQGAFLPETAGGAGGNGLDLMVVMEAIGKHLVSGPYAESIALGGALLAKDTKRLAAVAGGESIVTAALTERGSRFDLNHVETRAEKSGSGYKLSGAKLLAPYGGAADWILVPARTAGDTRSTEGITLFLLSRSEKSMTLKSQITSDGRRAASLALEGAVVAADSVVGEPGRGLVPLQRAVDLATLALCAEAVACMQHLLDATVAYSKVREQFGAKIGSFQALQHRMVDMFTSLETARSNVQAALAKVSGPEDTPDPLDVVLTKLHTDRAARHVGQEAVQLHGGMGMTDDLDVGHYFKRLTMMQQTYADEAQLMERYRALQEKG